MKLESISIYGFRCFDSIGETINFDDFTCFVGPNASGKTAMMMALVRLFGESNSQRQVVPTDFHLESGEKLKSKSPRNLTIECRLTFPELESEGNISSAVPETFNQMIVNEPGGTPYCRIRLEATWTDDGTPMGDIDQSLYWIVTSSDDPKIIDDGNRRKVQPGDRGKIRVVYIPATRDPNQQMKVTTNTNFGRLLGSLDLQDTETTLKEKLSILKNEIASLTGIQTINDEIQGTWNRFYDGVVAQKVSLQALEEDPASLIKLLSPIFRPSEDGCEMGTNDLSDGMRSLFSISFSLGLYKVEEMLKTSATKAGFKTGISNSIPILTFFTIEEPENHLSPHYLGRIISEFIKVAESENAQVLVSSHSPSILSRIQPDNVRYFLGNERSRTTHVKTIPLPMDDEDEAFKYVREAVKGYPELYFSRLVILGEGASEEIVLKRYFEVSGTPLDTYFISIVPLGGRHVNHFWRLLNGLEIPFITLLDLDREKEGAGWGRIQYVRDQLVDRFGKASNILQFETEDGEIHNLSDSEYDTFSINKDTDTDKMKVWLDYFQENFNVFFSAPLDLDLIMLEAFPDIYQGLAPYPKGPRLPESSEPNYWDVIKKRMRQVLASDASTAPVNLGDSYTPVQQQLFAWYKYLFVDGSKPVTHMRALLQIGDSMLETNAPDILKKIVKRARVILTLYKDDVQCH